MKTLKATLGALLFGAIGTIPWILVYVFFDYMLMILAMLITISAYYGYKKFGGKPGMKAVIIVGIVSVLIMTFTGLILLPLIVICNEYGYEFFTFDTIDMIYNEPLLNEFKQAVFKDYAYALIFALGGLFTVYGDMKNDKNKLVANIEDEVVEETVETEVVNESSKEENSEINSDFAIDQSQYEVSDKEEDK